MQNQSDDSFFGFETRLPRDMERTAVRQSVATSREPFNALSLDTFGDLRLEDMERRDATAFPARRPEDPWMQSASELNTIDSREIFSDLRNSRSSSGYGLTDLTRAQDHLEPRSTTESTNWRSASSPNFFGDKEDVEERLQVDLSELMDDSDSFNSAQNRQEFFNEFTKQTYLPYTPRVEPMTMESSSKDTSPWGSSSGPFSAFGGPWSGSEGSLSTQATTRQVSADTPKADSHPDEILTSINRQVPSVPNVVRTPMTLEELESQLMASPSSPPRREEPNKTSQVDSPRSPFQHTGSSPFQQPGNANQRLPQPQYPVPPGVADFRGGSPLPFSMMDPNVHRTGEMPRYGFVPIPGRMPHPAGARPPFMNQPPLGQMRYPYSPPRGQPDRGPHPGNFMPIRGMNHHFNGLPVRGPMPQFVPQAMGPFRGPGPRPMYGPMRMFPPVNRPMMSQVFVNQRYLPDVDNNSYDDDEEVTGWMTEREKDWVIKVQQSQVRTDNPYMDDYYYYVKSLKKLSKDTKGEANDFGEGDFIVPARMASEPKEDRQLSNHFEGSLGKVCISSVFNPRKTVDVDAINIAKNRLPPSNQKRRWFVDPLQKDKGHPKGLLLGIEELYKLVLELQDFSREIAALPEGQREHGIETRRNIINLIFDKLIQGTTPELRVRNFCDTVKIRKGRELLRRVLPILFKEQLLILTGYCVRALPILMEIPQEKLEGFGRCLGSIAEGLKAVTMKRLLEMLSPLVDTQHNLLNTAYTGQTLLMHAVKNQFALHFFSIFIARADDCYATEWTALSDENREKWTLFVTYLFISLTKASATDLAAFPNDALKKSVATHIGRFPFSPDSVEVCCAKFRVLSVV